jgi:asparagine synthase (glutamine-hydrolysing)
MPSLKLDMFSLGLYLPAGWMLVGADQPGNGSSGSPSADTPRRLPVAQEGAVRRRFRRHLSPAEPHGGVRHRGGVRARRHEVEPPLRTREEVAYYRIFAEELGEIRPQRTISRFATA